MTKQVDASVLNAALDVIATSVEMYLCTSDPANRAAADTASVIPAHTLTGGDFTQAIGDAGGDSRKVTVAAQNSLTADATGTVTNVVLCTGALMLYSTECTNQLVTDTNTVNIGAFDIEIAGAT